MLKIGDIAPTFKLPASGGKFIDLEKFKGKKLILYFYPQNDTPGCTLEAQTFSNLYSAFKKENCEIVGISKDSIIMHDKFCKKYDLAINLASDKHNNICENYGVWIEKSMYGKKYMGIERSTFLIDEKGLIAKSWRGVKVDGHVQEVLSEVCRS